MRASPKVRYLQKSDFDACWNIFFKVFERHEDEAFLNAWISYNPALSFVVIDDYDRTEGFLLTRDRHLEFIGIHPNSQGKGLGTILLHSLLDRCKRDIYKITLVPSNSDPKLIRWYEKHGFRKTNTFTKNNEPLLILNS